MPNPWLALDVWTDPRQKANELLKLWEEFLTRQTRPEGLRAGIAASWERCRAQGVDPLRTLAPRHLSEKELEEAWQSHPLTPYLEPVVKELSVLADGSGHLVVVCDGQGQILRLIGDRQVRREAEKMNFVPGSLWSEAAAGTNAIGTALAAGHPIQVFAAEHFCQPVHRWTCSAAPILDPATGRPLAVLDLTGFREVVHPHTLTAVVAAAQTVERQLRERLQEQRLFMLEQFLDAAGRHPRWDLAALDAAGYVLRAAPAFYNEGWVDPHGRLVGLPAGDLATLCPEGWEAEGRYGRRRFELRPVFQGATCVGALVRMVPVGGAGAARAESVAAPAARFSFAHLIGSAPAFRAAVEKAAQYAASHLPILIEGESGTGKELLAHAIHTASRRAWGPFVAVNCGAIPKDRMASEFFGYEGGTFTGAAREGRPGKFELAHGGTIFLDEIGEMPLDAQVYLLRVLEQGEVLRLGARAPVKVDVRVIAATNRDLAAAVRAGTFREDLYYRLNVLSIRMPPLRERQDDIPALFSHYLQRACREMGREPPALAPDAVAALQAYRWPGNVRELRNLAYRLAHTVQGHLIVRGDLPPEVAAAAPTVGARGDAPAGADAAAAPAATGAEPAPPPPGPDSLSRPEPSPAEALAAVRQLVGPLPELERAAFVQAWELCGRQVARVAELLGISRATAYRKAHQYGLLQPGNRRAAKP